MVAFRGGSLLMLMGMVAGLSAPPLTAAAGVCVVELSVDTLVVIAASVVLAGAGLPQPAASPRQLASPRQAQR